MNEELVYKNVYELEKRRMEDKMEHSIERNDARTDYFMARVEGTLSRMEGRLDAMDAKISNMGRTITLTVAIMGLILTGVSIYFSMPH